MSRACARPCTKMGGRVHVFRRSGPFVRHRLLALAAVPVALLAATPAAADSGQPTRADLAPLLEVSSGAIPGDYIVVLNDGVDLEQSAGFARALDAKVSRL